MENKSQSLNGTSAHRAQPHHFITNDHCATLSSKPCCIRSLAKCKNLMSPWIFEHYIVCTRKLMFLLSNSQSQKFHMVNFSIVNFSKYSFERKIRIFDLEKLHFYTLESYMRFSDRRAIKLPKETLSCRLASLSTVPKLKFSR